MKRRDILKGALAGAGAAAATAQETSHAEHTAQKSAAPPKTAWKPMLFDAHQNETVATLSDLIIPRTDTPGARDARVHEYIDLILHDGAIERRSRFLQGLGWLDGYAIREHKMPFVKLNQAQQIAILKALDGAAEAGLRPGAEFFRQIKQLTAQGYYTSKEGIAELNKGGKVPGTFGCAHEGGH